MASRIMKKTMFMLVMVVVFLIKLGSCQPDQCLNVTTGFRTNLKTLLDLLTKTAPLRDGFYETSVGNNSDRVYGMVQCKANTSSKACENCLKSSTGSLDGCREGTGIESLSSSCTLKFSDENFFGVWSNFSSASVVNDDGLDDPLVFSKGFSMMEGLAGSVPEQRLMYQAANVDVGGDAKRYGLAQCSRDLSKLNCRNCLEDRLVRYRSYVENRTGWEILGISCSIWYSNVSIVDDRVLTDPVANAPDSTAPPSSQGGLPQGKPTVVASGSQRYHGGSGIGIGMSMIIVSLTLLISIS